MKSFRPFILNRTGGWLLLAIVLMGGCKKADRFYGVLEALPQIDYEGTYAYKAAYIVGDTMTIVGRLQPQAHLRISIGGVPALIVRTDTVPYQALDQVSLLITDAMKGKAREVSVTSGGYTITGSPVDIYPTVGPGSFTDSLKSILVGNYFTSGDILLYCVNGKGDVYYYASATNDLRHIGKDGSMNVVYDLTGMIDPARSLVLRSFIAGGVDPTGKYLYFSGITSVGYALCQLDLTTHALTLLNLSSRVMSPYEGPIGLAQLIVTGIYPDANGNLYLAVGLGNGNLNANNGKIFLPDAIVRYDATSGAITYIYKQIAGNIFNGMPGILSGATEPVIDLRFSPEEDLLYVLERDAGTQATYIQLYNMAARTRIADINTLNTTGNLTAFDVISPFSALKINITPGDRPDNAFGYLPLPGKRLQTLLFSYIEGGILNQGVKNIAQQLEFPRWIVFDFTDSRTYAYAAGRYDNGTFVFQPTNNLGIPTTFPDELLNYDEQGHLYMTANGRTALIKTHTVN